MWRDFLSNEEVADFISDNLSGDIEENIRLLQEKLDEEIPAKSMDSNLLIATWNIKAFGGLTKKWESSGNDSPKRDLHSLRCIAEIISRFDVIAIQEVRGDARALRYLLKFLDPNWGLLMTDITKGNKGNDERLAFLFDKRRVSLSGLAGEIVIPDEEITKEQGDPREYLLKTQFARTPYAVGFRTRNTTFVLITVHVKYKGGRVKRIPEIFALAKWLGNWARDINSWEHNLITLGDFNIDRMDDINFEAFISSGLEVHPHFINLPRTYSDLGKTPDNQNFYDQIAWFTGVDNKPALTMNYLKGGFFNFTDCALENRGLTNAQLQHFISDHFPLWAEFEIRELPEDFIPKVPKRITSAQRRRKEQNDILRRAINKTITSLENAISEFQYVIDSAQPTIELHDDAINYLTSEAYDIRCINRLKEALSNQNIEATLQKPIDAARNLANAAIALVSARANNTNIILEADLQTILTNQGYWPFRAR